jgi:hypothetical protein
MPPKMSSITAGGVCVPQVENHGLITWKSSSTASVLFSNGLHPGTCVAGAKRSEQEAHLLGYHPVYFLRPYTPRES